MSASLNRAVREHLRRISDGEREKTTRFLVRLRAGVTSLYALSIVWLLVKDRDPSSRLTLPIFIAYASVSVLLALGAQLSRRVQRLSSLAVPLLDIPTMSVASYVALQAMPRPEFVLGSLLPFLAGAIMLATLTLDYGVIALATVSAAVSSIVIVHALGAPTAEVVDPAFAMACLGALSAFLVSRLRALVEESRRKDFAGKYILGDRIGVGGMAEVFAATYSPAGSFERRVAVKRVLPAYAGNEDFVALFRREAEVGAQLAHPNLVQVLDFGRHLDSWFIAMEFIEGVTLSAVMRAQHAKEERVPLAACLYVVCEIGEALTYLHEKRSPDGASVGLVHRDLNPPNVLVSKSGEVKVSDFGVARWLDSGSLTKAGTVRGKLAYMAPEYLSGSPASPGGDLYALGVLAHELLTGRRMHAGRSDAEIARLVVEEVCEPPSTSRPEVPPVVDAFVMSLLERDPAVRLRSARDVVRQLRGLDGPLAVYPHGRLALVAAVAVLTLEPPVTGGPPSSDPTARTHTIPDALQQSP